MNYNIIAGIVIIVVILVGIFVFLNSSTDTTKITEQETKEVRKLIIVTDPYKPFVYADEDGTVIGVTVDIADRIFTNLDVPYEIQIIPWLRVLKELETGEADAVSPASYSPERAEFLYYTEEEINYTEGPLPSSSILDSETVFFARKVVKDSFPLETFESLDDIRDAGIRVGAIEGWRSTGRLHDAGVDVVEYITIPMQFQALEDGVVDIVLQEKIVGLVILKNEGFGDTITMLNKTFFRDPMYLLFAKASDYPNLLELREEFLVEMRKIRESGEYDEIYNRYVQ